MKQQINICDKCGQSPALSGDCYLKLSNRSSNLIKVNIKWIKSNIQSSDNIKPYIMGMPVTLPIEFAEIEEQPTRFTPMDLCFKCFLELLEQLQSVVTDYVSLQNSDKKEVLK